MRTKAIDYCSCCECDILWIDEEEGWVNYVPTGAFDKFGSDCSATEFSDLRETSQKINEWLYDQISLIS